MIFGYVLRPPPMNNVKVVTKICFSLTSRVKNRPQLVKDGLLALCAKVISVSTAVCGRLDHLLGMLEGHERQNMQSEGGEPNMVSFRQ